jgi:hypothetical protein
VDSRGPLSRAWSRFGPPVCPGQFDIKRRPETVEMRVVVLITPEVAGSNPAGAGRRVRKLA